MFHADPTLITPSQRLAQAHASQNKELPLEDTTGSSDDGSSAESPQETEIQNVKLNSSPRGVNFNDETAFPTLGGRTVEKPKSLWGTTRNIVRTNPVASQVISQSDLITETVKLEAAQQQTRSLGKNQTGDVVKSVQKSTGTTIQMSTAQKTGTTVFLIKGKPEAVASAKKALLKELGKKVGVRRNIKTWLILLGSPEDARPECRTAIYHWLEGSYTQSYH